MPENQWTDVGSVEELKRTEIQEVQCGKTRIALTYKNEKFSAISGVCNQTEETTTQPPPTRPSDCPSTGIDSCRRHCDDRDDRRTSPIQYI
jgi:hypothetical protein